MTFRYDSIGVDYARLRRPDPRIAAVVARALGAAKSILNVGAGTGSYEPTDRALVAVEPSSAMIARRSRNAAPVVQAVAEHLPFRDATFDASMAILTVHHWSDPAAGLGEMRRVTRGPVVVLTYDPAWRPWLTDYLPELAELDTRQMPPLSIYRVSLGTIEIVPVPVPHDCVDGFLHAYWRRPEAYLDPLVRSGMSSFWTIDAEAGLQELRRDIASGAWHHRYAALVARDHYDAGYRLVIATP